jgi:hypothetical protein
MSRVATSCFVIVVALMLVSGVAKVWNPGQNDVIPASGQVLLGAVELAFAFLLATRRILRRAIMYVCAVGALLGVVFHATLATQGKSCGCLGGWTPRGLETMLAAMLGMCSCLWLSCRRHPARTASRSVLS